MSSPIRPRSEIQAALVEQRDKLLLSMAAALCFVLELQGLVDTASGIRRVAKQFDDLKRALDDFPEENETP